MADADDPATEDVDESKVPTQEALDAAKAEAEDILAQWEASDKTAESFGALAEEYSDDPGSNTNGGLYEQVAPGVMFEGFNDWIFADGRAIGDTGLVENPQDASRAGTSSTWRAGTSPSGSSPARRCSALATHPACSRSTYHAHLRNRIH